ncbi:PAS domain-containing sensor histidine kinase [Aureimonas frigidaquae]|uniref:Blue-light-activated histidine kinase n=1 Tax=Aureimonas frigidaquae TaxID=424757 RepID=A0A0P0Z3M0_9HYPH|nr:PAS domain-containing protein [Aureimonas frigidaquae]BAT28712.1 signal transduction histidine kinase [Aureimonas frigidaquae]
MRWPNADDVMAARIRALDWSRTPLGPIESWPPSLRHAVDTTLMGQVASILLWGPELTQIYNDEWRRLMGGKDRHALGQASFECFPETETAMRPIYARVRRGEVVVLRDIALPVTRSGTQATEAWWNVHLIPVRDEEARVSGIFCTVIETTQAVLAEREREAAAVSLRDNQKRQAFLLKLSDALRPLSDAQHIRLAAATVLGEEVGACRVAFAEHEPDQRSYTVTRNYVRGAPELTGRFEYDGFGASLLQRLKRGEVIVQPDIARDPALSPDERQALLAAGIGASMNVPLVKDGRLVAFLGVNHAQAHAFTPLEIQLCEDVAERSWAAIERARSEEALRESEKWLRTALDVGKLGLWDWNIETGRLHWSDEHFRLEGYDVDEISPSYDAWAARIHPQDRAATEAALQEAMRERREYVREFRVVHGDGSVHWLYGRGRFFYGADGTPLRMIGAMIETTERRKWEDRQKMLVAELQHRTHNLLGVIRAMSDKTLRSSTDLNHFRLRFFDRLNALARVQALLSRLDGNDRVTFDELLSAEMDAMNGSADQVLLEGPPGVRLRTSSVQVLAMALHELATNALKYGALSQPAGRLSIRWSLGRDDEDTKPWLFIDWRETGVRMPAGMAEGKGQGRELIERALPYQLGARTDFDLTPDGVHCTIAMPVSARHAEPG